MPRLLCLTEAGKRRAKMALIRKMLVPFVIFQTIVVGSLIFFLRLTAMQSVGVVALAFLVLRLFVYRTWRNPAFSFQNWGLHLGDDSIYLTEHPDDTEIRRGEIAAIVESADGLRIKGTRSDRGFWIPSGVEDYASVKRTLESWMRNPS